MADNNDVLEAVVGLKKLLDVIGTRTGQTELDIRAMKFDISQLKSDVRRLDEKTDRIETKLDWHETRIEALEA